jgi:hypothetical protein
MIWNSRLHHFISFRSGSTPELAHLEKRPRSLTTLFRPPTPVVAMLMKSTPVLLQELFPNYSSRLSLRQPFEHSPPTPP